MKFDWERQCPANLMSLLHLRVLRAYMGSKYMLIVRKYERGSGERYGLSFMRSLASLSL